MTNMLCQSSEAPKLLAPPHGRTLLAERVSARGLVSVTAVFESDAAHNEIRWFTDFLCEKIGAEIEVSVRHWTYHELQHLRAGRVAAELAEQTDILLLVTRADEVLPPAVALWIAGWLLQAHPSCAAVCLVGSGDNIVESSITGHLRRACETAGIQFFVSGFTVDARHARRSSGSCSNAGDRFEGFGIMHWGINE